MRIEWLLGPALLALAPAAAAQTGTSLGPPVRGGNVIYGEPVAVPMPPLAPVVAAPDAIVARAALRADERRWRMVSPLRIPAPIGVTVPGGTLFGSRLGAGGVTEACLSRPEGQAYSPYVDDQGHFYPDICLQSPAPDGSYGQARLVPYRADWEPRVFTLGPVRLEPIAPPAGFVPASQIGVRRLRIATIDAAGAHLVAEDRIISRPPPDAMVEDLVATGEYDSVGEALLPLRAGARVTLAGVTLAAVRDGSDWKIAASGDFEPFVRLSDRGSTIVTFRHR